MIWIGFSAKLSATNDKRELSLRNKQGALFLLCFSFPFFSRRQKRPVLAFRRFLLFRDSNAGFGCVKNGCSADLKNVPASAIVFLGRVPCCGFREESNELLETFVTLYDLSGSFAPARSMIFNTIQADPIWRGGRCFPR